MGNWVALSGAYSPGDHRLQRVVGSEPTKASSPAQSCAAHGVPGVDGGLLRSPLASGRTGTGQWAGAMHRGACRFLLDLPWPWIFRAQAAHLSGRQGKSRRVEELTGPQIHWPPTPPT